jgi:hypothetical protein
MDSTKDDLANAMLQYSTIKYREFGRGWLSDDQISILALGDEIGRLRSLYNSVQERLVIALDNQSNSNQYSGYYNL